MTEGAQDFSQGHPEGHVFVPVVAFLGASLELWGLNEAFSVHLSKLVRGLSLSTIVRSVPKALAGPLGPSTQLGEVGLPLLSIRQMSVSPATMGSRTRQLRGERQW